jgi:hypothetical protein
MSYSGYFKYVLQNTPAVLFKNSNSGSGVTGCITILLPSFGVYFLAVILKYSYFFKKIVLVDLGGYDILKYKNLQSLDATMDDNTNLKLQYMPVLWYLFKGNTGSQIFVFSFQCQKFHFQSIELLFRNAR